MTVSYGQSLLKRYLEIVTNTLFYENYRPDFMMGLELDYYFPNEKVAFEFNGDQHYYQTEKFGDPNKQIRNDSYKRVLCWKNGIKLITIEASTLDPIRIRHKTKNKGLLSNAVYKQVTKDNSKLLKIYSEEVKKYIEILKKNFNSPTAYKAGSVQKAKVVMENTGMNVITAEDIRATRQKIKRAKLNKVKAEKRQAIVEKIKLRKTKRFLDN